MTKYREKATVFPLLFLLLRSDELAVFPHVVVVFIRYRLGLPRCDKSRKPVYENVLHFRVGVRTRLLLAESEGFEPPEALTSTVFKTAAIDHSANFP